MEHVAHFKHGVGGLLVDLDGSLTGGSPLDEGAAGQGGYVVPPTGQWRTNSNCTVDASGRCVVVAGGGGDWVAKGGGVVKGQRAREGVGEAQ